MSSTQKREITILPDAGAITRRAADEFMKALNEAVARKGSFSVALSGGSTPRALYTMLADDPAYRSKIPWPKLYFFFGDERHVGPDSPESNYRMANETLFSKGLIKPEQIFRIKGEYPEAEKAALDYEQTLRSHFKLKGHEYPSFDLMFVGMGEEGHCLSLFPGTKALQAPPQRIVVHNWVGKLYTDRITLTAAAANQSNRIIFLVTRSDKALALKGVLEGPYEPEQLPSQLIQPVSGNLLWLVDHDAASMLATQARNATN